MFSSAAQGPVTETLCTRLAPPGGSLYAEEIRFFPVNAFVLFSKWTKFSMIRRQCQAVWLILKMKEFSKIVHGSIRCILQSIRAGDRPGEGQA